MQKIYCASKTKHAWLWKNLRNRGVRICSTWIDEAGIGETADFVDLWTRCITEASECDVLLLYRQQDDVLKGAFIEAGAALAAGKTVFAVGCEEFSFIAHPRVHTYSSLTEALSALNVKLVL